MPRVTIDDFSAGLWVSSPADKLPTGTVRRATAFNHVPTRSARVRNGSSVLVDGVGHAHSLMRYNDMRFQGVLALLYNDGTLIDSGYNGSRLSFAAMPPTVDLQDYLFISGGGQLRKVSPNGSTVSKWGIAAPTGGFTATKQARKEQQVEALDVTTGWSSNNITTAIDATVKQEGAASLKLSLDADTLGQAWKNITTVDLTEYSADSTVLGDQDFVLLWVLVTDPEALEYLQIDFNVDSANWSVVDSVGQSPNTYTIKVNPSEADSTISGVAASLDEGQFANDNKARATVNTGDVRISDAANRALVHELGTTKLKAGGNVWTELRIPKSSFERKGDGTLGWESVRGIRFSIKTNDTSTCAVLVDDLRAGGAVGMQGGYKHFITFQNSTTGHRSNPNHTAVATHKVDREGILLSGLPTTCPDSQVDTVEIWRTFGDGATFFKAGEVDLGTSTFLDEVADYYGLHTNTGDYLQSLELEFDNDPPEDTYGDCVGPWQGRMWWTRDTATGAQGRVYYSPEGRPEAVQGFVNVTETDDPCQRVVMWSGHLYVWSEKHVFEIVGSDEPFVYREFEGVPGTDKPFTVIASPFGIIYTSREGVTVFDGSHSQLLYPDAILPLFHGDTRAGLPPFYPVIATVWHDNYFISDTSRTYSVNSKGVWREFGLAINAFFPEPDTNLLTAAVGDNVLSLEQPGYFSDAGTEIPFKLETPALYVGTGKIGLLQRLFIEIDSPTESVTPTLILDDGTELILPVITGPVRGVPWEFALGQTVRYAAVRLDAATMVGPLEVLEISIDVAIGLEDDDSAPFAKVRELLGIKGA